VSNFFFSQHDSYSVGHQVRTNQHLLGLESNYRLTHILRGPSKILFPNRDGTKDMDIWAVEFEPGIGQSKEMKKAK
jgi:hypothetical protein